MFPITWKNISKHKFSKVEEQTEGEYGISDTVELKAVEKQKEEESSNDKNGLERTESELASETNKKVKLQANNIKLRTHLKKEGGNAPVFEDPNIKDGSKNIGIKAASTEKEIEPKIKEIRKRGRKAQPVQAAEKSVDLHSEKKLKK